MSKLVPCKACGKQIAFDVTCPHCGKNNKRVTTGASGCVILCCILFVLISLLGSLSDSGSSSSRPDTARDSDAIIMAQDFVEQRLRSPASAKFPWSDEHRVVKVPDQPNVWRINSYVDSQNGFGAMIRSRWYCELEYIGDDKWILKDIAIGD